MMYVYDTIIQPYETTLKRYGGTYTLKNISRMEQQRFYLFEASGRESPGRSKSPLRTPRAWAFLPMPLNP